MYKLKRYDIIHMYKGRRSRILRWSWLTRERRESSTKGLFIAQRVARLVYRHREKKLSFMSRWRVTRDRGRDRRSKITRQSLYNLYIYICIIPITFVHRSKCRRWILLLVYIRFARLLEIIHRIDEFRIDIYLAFKSIDDISIQILVYHLLFVFFFLFLFIFLSNRSNIAQHNRCFSFSKSRRFFLFFFSCSLSLSLSLYLKGSEDFCS